MRCQKVEMPRFSILLVAAAVIAAVTCVPGSCPPTLSVDICAIMCSSNVPCEAEKLCCSTACGGFICVDPMTQRHNTILVKIGTCPMDPRGPWICRHTCTSDSDCPGAAKCCRNRCKALTCQIPDPSK